MSESIPAIKIGTYNGTLESLNDLVKNLKLEPNDYLFNAIDQSVKVWKYGLILRRGDCYQFPPEPEKFECI